MKSIIIASLIAIVLIVGTVTPVYAIYLGNVGSDGSTGKGTIEESLALARLKVQTAEDNPATGSGTPYLSADGVLGATAISAVIFGGIAGAFFVKARSGKYYAQGRG